MIARKENPRASLDAAGLTPLEQRLLEAWRASGKPLGLLIACRRSAVRLADVSDADLVEMLERQVAEKRSAPIEVEP